MTSKIMQLSISSQYDYAFMFLLLKQFVGEKFHETEKKGSLLTDENIQPTLKFAMLHE